MEVKDSLRLAANITADYFTTIANEAPKLNPWRYTLQIIKITTINEHFTELKELSVIKDHEVREIIIHSQKNKNFLLGRRFLSFSPTICRYTSVHTDNTSCTVGDNTVIV